jgi:hypothetical protein
VHFPRRSARSAGRFEKISTCFGDLEGLSLAKTGPQDLHSLAAREWPKHSHSLLAIQACFPQSLRDVDLLFTSDLRASIVRFWHRTRPRLMFFSG